MLTDYLNRTDWKERADRWRELHDVRPQPGVETPDRKLAAAERALTMAPTLAAEAGAARAGNIADWLGANGKERLVGSADFEPASFFEIGLAISRAVCFVEVKNALGQTLSRGTGFLVAPGVMVTNQHVIKSVDEARSTHVTFDYRNDPRGHPMATTTFALAPERLFVTNADLDCTFVAVGDRMTGASALTGFPWLPLIGAQGKVVVGDPVNIVQHPRGEPLQFAIRDNRLLLLPQLKGRDENTYAHYEADTMPGSSGAPVLSRMWEVVALHHQAIPDMDGNGQVLDLKGRPYLGTDETQVRWIGNEGIRVSTLVKFLDEVRSQSPGPARALIDSVLEARRPDYVDMALRARESSTGNGVAKSMGVNVPAGATEFILALRISISLGEPKMIPPAAPDESPALPPAPDET